MIKICRYSPEMEGALADFHEELESRGFSYRFATHEGIYAVDTTSTVKYTYYLAMDDDVVVGTYKLKEQQFFFAGGGTRFVGMYQMPISKGIYEKKYAMVGFQLLRHAIAQSPECYCLGMGSESHPVAIMTKSLGWRMSAVPFYFHILSASAVVAKMPIIRRRLGSFASIIASVGIGSIIVGLVQQGFRARSIPGITYRRVPQFDKKVDDLWTEVSSDYSFIGARDLQTVKVLYPTTESKYHLLEIYKDGVYVGWTVLAISKMNQTQYFGDLRVAVIVDGLSDPGNVESLVWASQRYARLAGAELIVTNQSHYAWQAALKSQRFMSWASNFILAISPKLANAISEKTEDLYLNRGDNDGPRGLLGRDGDPA